MVVGLRSYRGSSVRSGCEPWPVHPSAELGERVFFAVPVARASAQRRPRKLLLRHVVADLNLAVDRHRLELDVDRSVVVDECDPDPIPKILPVSRRDHVRELHLAIVHWVSPAVDEHATDASRARTRAVRAPCQPAPTLNSRRIRSLPPKPRVAGPGVAWQAPVGWCYGYATRRS